jgi:hypothetical protein
MKAASCPVPENGALVVATIQNVEDHPSRRDSCCSGHAQQFTTNIRPSQSWIWPAGLPMNRFFVPFYFRFLLFVTIRVSPDRGLGKSLQS